MEGMKAIVLASWLFSARRRRAGEDGFSAAGGEAGNLDRVSTYGQYSVCPGLGAQSRSPGTSGARIY